MRKIDLKDRPEAFAEDVVQKKTEKFLENGHYYLTKAMRNEVLSLTGGKCIYSEAPIETSGSKTEIDHFLPKCKHPELVYEWGNLLPSCGKINSTKWEHDPSSEQIINPLNDDPSSHLYFHSYRLKHKTDMGERSIEVLGLNDHTHFVQARFRETLVFLDKIEVISKEMENGKDLSIIKHKIKSILKGVLSANYSACVSTEVIKDEFFVQIRNELTRKGIWDEGIEEQYNYVCKRALVKKL